MNDPSLGSACPVYSCLFLDMGLQHDVRVEGGGLLSAGNRLVILVHKDLTEKWTCSRA